MEKGLMKVLKDGTYLGVHPETESSQVTDFTAAVKATKVDNATASDKLATARTIALSGKATGSASFDGSGDVSIAVTSSAADTATKLATARSIGLTGLIEGAVSFDGSGDVSIATTSPTVFDNAGAHNALYRGKNITAYWDSGEMSKAIAAGTFAGIYPGDYIVKSVTVDGTTYSNVEWVIGDLDYHLHRGDTEDTTHHVLVFPRAHIGNKPMNATNITAGGFVGSVMWTTTLPLYATGIKAAFGADHVLNHRELLTNAESDTIASGAGAGYSGATTGWSWYDVTVNLFNEPMVYGGRVLSSSFFDVGDCNTQVAAMRHNKSLSFDRSYWCWLRAVASSSNFAYAYGNGDAGYGAASSSDGGVRPYFLLH